jgi:guanylate kinase
MSGRLIILAGPSCVGKSPLDKALGRFFPDLKNTLQTLVLYNDRNRRPGEQDGVDYHFRSREYINSLRENKQFVVMEVRGDLQALDLDDLASALSHGNVFFEGNPFIGYLLLSHEALREIPKLSVFMSPVSRDELLFFNQHKMEISPADLVTDIMRRKLLRRTKKQKSELALPDYENIEKRASSAYYELGFAHHFDYVLPNHDGEDSEHWDAFTFPIGEARISLLTFVDLVEGRTTGHTEKWEPVLVQ